MAHHCLLRVLQDGAFANLVLNKTLSRWALSPRDNALATELTMGTLRHQHTLDQSLQRHLHKPLKSLPQPVLCALRLGAYQLLFLRIQTHAAVFDTVNLVAGFGALKGLANAVLRKLVGAPLDPTAKSHAAIEGNATSHTHALPHWYATKVFEVLAEDERQAWHDAHLTRPKVTLRVNRLRAHPDEILKRIKGSVQSPWLKDSVIVENPGAIEALWGFHEGLWTVQDSAATAVGLMAAPKPGDVVVDMCAAPGGKATHLAEMMHDEGVILAIDKHPQRVELLKAHTRRLRLESLHPCVSDASVQENIIAHLESLGHQRANVVLVDAPCSGMGTLRRHPELRRRTLQDTEHVLNVQAKLIDVAVNVACKDATIVYAVCTSNPEEGQQQADAAKLRHPCLNILAPPKFLAPLCQGRTLRTWPHRHQMDGFFGIAWRKT